MFRCSERHEIHRDPEGHYHHWTVLSGRLTAGSLEVARPVWLTDEHQGIAVARIVGFYAFRDPPVTSKSKVTSELTKDAEFGVFVWGPAPRDDQPAPALVEPITDARYEEVLREMVLGGVSWCPCADCTRPLMRLEGAREFWPSIRWSVHPYGRKPPEFPIAAK